MAEDRTLPTLHHATYTVTDAEATLDFYASLLGEPSDVARRKGENWTRLRVVWPNGLMLGFTEHTATLADDTFDHRRIGLDHVGLSCSSESEVAQWSAAMDELGITHGPIEETEYAIVVTGRDPDAIPVEFYYLKPEHP